MIGVLWDFFTCLVSNCDVVVVQRIRNFFWICVCGAIVLYDGR